MSTIIKIFKGKTLSLLTICLLGATSLYCGELNFYLRNLSADSVSNVLLIDKSKQSLLVIRSNLPGAVQVLDSFRITTGKVDGNKEVEGDRKTPEGIYDIISVISSNLLPTKYGPLAFVLNYPNHIDKIHGRNGSNIWIHGRNEEITDRQTEGCVSLENGKLLVLTNYIRLNNTPVVIIDNLNHSDGSPDAPKFTLTDSLFNNWLKYWNAGDIESYAKYYSPYFKSQSQSDRAQYITTKKQLEQIYNWKKVSADQVWLLQSDHEARINFQQEYLCPKFYSRGYKQLVLMWSDSCWQIVGEKFSALIPRIYIEPTLRSFLKSWETA
jgi:murein L,D-transpeptidase YafK